MQTPCLEEYDVKALLFSQVAWSLFLEKMDPDFGRTLVPECTEFFRPGICKNENRSAF